MDRKLCPLFMAGNLAWGDKDEALGYEDAKLQARCLEDECGFWANTDNFKAPYIATGIGGTKIESQECAIITIAKAIDILNKGYKLWQTERLVRFILINRSIGRR